MFRSMEKNKLGVRIILGVVVGAIAISMLLYLVPGMGSSNVTGNDVVASVAGQSISTVEVNRQLSRIQSSGQMPPQLKPLYAQQIIQQLVTEKMIEIEAQRLGIDVTETDVANRIKMILPTAFENGAPVPMDAYAAQVQSRFQMGVEEFEELVRQSLLQERVGQLVTSGVTVTADEIQAEFRRKNEKVKLDYVLVQPDALQSQVQISDADLASYYDKNKARYLVPELRVVQYVLIDPGQLMAKLNIPEADLQASYKEHIDAFKVEDRVQISQILFKTIGKTDAEVAEIRKKAEDALKQAKQKGANFEDLAKKYSDDSTKDAGGQTGWIVRGQAMPELEKAAFSLQKGETSDLIQTQIGFYIIKVTDKESAHTKSFAEVMPELQADLATRRAQNLAEDDAQKMGEQIRQTAHPSLDALAKQYNLDVAVTKPLGPADLTPELGNSPDIHDTIFRQRIGDVSQPIRTDRGYVILSVKSVSPAHQGTLAEMHDKILSDYRHEKAVELARQRASDLAKLSQNGGDLAKAAKVSGLEMKTSDELARDGSIQGVGPVKDFQDAFSLPAGKTGDPVFLGANWVVYRVADHQQPNQADFDKQEKDIEQTLLDAKRQMVFESFRSALQAEMTKEGKLTYNADVMKQLTSPT
jgi:peptidyl-prolyl cis-trans isomerase D